MTSFSNNKPINEGPNVEKIGQKLESGGKLVKIVDEVVSQKLRESDNARKASQAEFRVRMEKYEAQIRQLKRRIADKDKNVKPTRKALYTTVIIVVISFLLLTLLGNTMAGKEHNILLEKLSNEMSETSYRISEMEKSLAQEFVKSRQTDCSHVSRESAKRNNESGGVFDIYPGESGRKMEVYCDLTTDGGGWTVIQRRIDGSVNFNRNWAEYVAGFGKPEHELWIGLEKLHRLTSGGNYELRIDLEDWEGRIGYALYTKFLVEDSSTKYQLNVDGYSGTAGDSLSCHNGQKFSTPDQDNDSNSSNCAQRHRGGWWYKSCHYSNINGEY